MAGSMDGMIDSVMGVASKMARVHRVLTGTIPRQGRDEVSYTATIYQLTPSISGHDYLAHITFLGARDDGREADVIRLCHPADADDHAGLTASGHVPLALGADTDQLFLPCGSDKEALDSMAGICASLVAAEHPFDLPPDEMRPLVVRRVLRVLGYLVPAQA